MLVFLSDLHLTDGTSGDTIHSDAFAKFAFTLEDMAVTAGAKEIDIVLLGDIFDVIRSNYWFTSSIRPWSGNDERDSTGKTLKDYTAEILARIMNNKINKESRRHLMDLKEKMAGKGIPLNFQYLIGNHDWLINYYPETRVMTAEYFAMDNAGQYKQKRFETEAFYHKYKVFARHGDIYDALNYNLNRDSSSVGDALMIELVDKFCHTITQVISEQSEPVLVPLLKEIDNVRPMWDVPLWIRGACTMAASSETKKKVKKIWNGLVDEFIKNDLRRKFGNNGTLSTKLGMYVTLFLSKQNPLIADAAEIFKKTIVPLVRRGDNFDDKAFNEKYLAENRAEYVVFGHTHLNKIQPLDKVFENGLPLNKTYFNTGTWRKLHLKAVFNNQQQFLSWHVMTFIAFYLEHERGKRKFEVWSGALGGR
jgi:UDP-2,3-diacylglucosamine pyrophosphatase LpxH